MIIKPTTEQIEFCKEYLNNNSIANRGKFDGDYQKQFIGILAQIIVGDYLNCSRPVKQNNFDGGYDLILNDKKIDVKCEIRSVDFNKELFVHNLTGTQIKYKCNKYIFVSYNKTKDEFEICGYIDKIMFRYYATYFEPGTIRTRTNGTTFNVGELGMYEIENKYLKDIKAINSNSFNHTIHIT